MKPITKRVAAASSDGVKIDMHFGHAEVFYIFDSDGESAALVEERSVSKYCADDEGERQKVFDMLSDCDAVITLRIGPGPTKKLEESGKRVISVYDDTQAAVLAAAKELIGG